MLKRISTKHQRLAYNYKVIFLGGRQAGCIGLLTAICAGCKIIGVVAYDDILKQLAIEFGLPMFDSLQQPELEKLFLESDLLLSVHCPQIIPKRLLDLPRFGGINVHPCLYRYKGLHPVERLLKDGCTLASVGVHRMTTRVDEGKVLAEEFVDVAGKKSVVEIYNTLYPFYATILLKALKKLEDLP